MRRPVIKYLLMFVILVLIQVMLLNQVQFSGYLNPYIYVLFVMLMPLNSPKYIQLIMAFILGLIIDIFSNTLGIHSFATVLIAYLRPVIISSISLRDENKNDYPGLKQNKFLWFLYYSSIMVIIHHFTLFFLEIFSFHNFFLTLLRVFVSSFVTVFIIVLSQFLIFRE